jgi:hypothetical protein
LCDLQDVTLKYTAANSTTPQHINDAAKDVLTPVVVPQVPAVETESAVTPASEPVALGTEASVSAASWSKRLQRVEGNSSEPIPQEKTQLQEEGSPVGRMVNRDTELDPSGEYVCQTGLVAVTEKANISGQMEGGTEEEGYLRESCLEKVSTPQGISHV